jgi:hypothetical protein
VKDLKVQPVDDAPIISASGSVGYKLNASSIVVAPAATVIDVDNANFNTGNLTVHIATKAEAANRLVIGGNFTVSNFQVKLGTTVIGTINANGGVGMTDLVVTFNSNATVSRVQQLMRAIRFRTLASTTTGDRAVSFSVNDGAGGFSNTAVRTVQVTSTGP